MTIFDGVGLDEAPGDEEGDELDCTSGPACSMQEDEGRTVFVLSRQVALPAVIVLDVGYASLLPVDAAEGVTSYSASWVVRAQKGKP